MADRANLTKVSICAENKSRKKVTSRCCCCGLWVVRSGLRVSAVVRLVVLITSLISLLILEYYLVLSIILAFREHEKAN
jgi:hypothetical protein